MDAVDVLAISTHPDDVEINMGGTILLMVASGLRVAVLDLTDGEPTPRGSRKGRLRESGGAAKILGLTARITLDMENRYLFDSKENRLEVAAVIRQLRPRALFAPHPKDVHPDHVQANAIASGGRFCAKLTRTDLPGKPHFVPRLYLYRSNHLIDRVSPSFIVDVSRYFDEKMRAVLCYSSQFYGRKRDNIRDLLERYNGYWGLTVGCKFGEPFIAFGELGISDIRAVIE